MAIWGVVAAILAVVGLITMVAMLAMRAERRKWETREAMAKTEGEVDARRAAEYLAEHPARADDAFRIVRKPPAAPPVEPHPPGAG